MESKLILSVYYEIIRFNILLNVPSSLIDTFVAFGLKSCSCMLYG